MYLIEEALSPVILQLNLLTKVLLPINSDFCHQSLLGFSASAMCMSECNWLTLLAATKSGQHRYDVCIYAGWTQEYAQMLAAGNFSLGIHDHRYDSKSRQLDPPMRKKEEKRPVFSRLPNGFGYIVQHTIQKWPNFPHCWPRLLSSCP